MSSRSGVQASGVKTMIKTSGTRAVGQGNSHHVDNSTTGALRIHKATQSRNVDPSPHDTANRGKTSIIPTSHVSVLDKPCELPFAQNRVCEVYPRECVNPHTAQIESLLNPTVLFVSVIAAFQNKGHYETSC